MLRANRLIIDQAKFEIESENTSQPCAKLALYIYKRTDPDSDKFYDNLYNLLIEEFKQVAITAHLVDFVSELAFVGLGETNENPKIAWQVVRQRLNKAIGLDTAQIRLENLLREVYWPDNVKKVSPEEIRGIESKSKKPANTSGKLFFSEKIGRFIKCATTLEKRVYGTVEYSDRVIYYIPHPQKILYKEGDTVRSHYPDLFVVLNDYRVIIVEITPAFYMALSRNLAIFEAVKDYCDREGYGFLVTDGYSTLNKFRNHRINSQYEKEVLNYLDKNGTLDWDSYKVIRDKYNAAIGDFIGLIVQNKLSWRLGPFKISKAAN